MNSYIVEISFPQLYIHIYMHSYVSVFVYIYIFMHTQSCIYNLRLVEVDYLYVSVQISYLSTVIILKYISQLGAFRSRESDS